MQIQRGVYMPKVERDEKTGKRFFKQENCQIKGCETRAMRICENCGFLMCLEHYMIRMVERDDETHNGTSYIIICPKCKTGKGEGGEKDE